MTEADRIARFANVPLPLAQLVVIEARNMDIDVRSLRGPRRNKHLVAARRRIATKACKQRWSLQLIGRALNRDHSSIVNLVGKGATGRGFHSPPKDDPYWSLVGKAASVETFDQEALPL